jgi:hypothetical protein
MAKSSGAEIDLANGIYERLISHSLEPRLRALDGENRTKIERIAVDPAEAHVVLARHVHGILEKALRAIPEKQRPDAQVDLTNRILELIASSIAEHSIPADLVTSDLLLACLPRDSMNDPAPLARPGIPLSQSALLVNAPREHRIGAEITAELDSADRVDLLCSFVKWSGYIRIRDALTAHLRLRGRELRIITTSRPGSSSG